MEADREGSAHLRRIERRMSSIVWLPPRATLNHPFLVESSPTPSIRRILEHHRQPEGGFNRRATVEIRNKPFSAALLQMGYSLHSGWWGENLRVCERISIDPCFRSSGNILLQCRITVVPGNQDGRCFTTSLFNIPRKIEILEVLTEWKKVNRVHPRVSSSSECAINIFTGFQVSVVVSFNPMPIRDLQNDGAGKSTVLRSGFPWI